MVNELKMRIGNGNQLGLHRSVLMCLGNPKHLMFFVNKTNNPNFSVDIRNGIKYFTLN